MRTRNLLIIVATMWQVCTAQENCPGVKLAAGIGSLLGDVPISSSAPELPLLPELGIGGCGRGEFLEELPGLPHLPCGPSIPSIPSLPYADCGCSSSLPDLPELPSLPGDCFDYPFYGGEPLPYLKRKGCGCLARRRGCGLRKCHLRECALKKSRLEEEEDCGFGLKVVPLIKKFPLKKKFDGYDNIESLPCELPSLLSGVVRGSLYNNGCY